jgi:hypothetical protein
LVTPGGFEQMQIERELSVPLTLLFKVHGAGPLKSAKKVSCVGAQFFREKVSIR